MIDIEKKIINICKSSLLASRSISKTSNSERNKALKLMAEKLTQKKEIILKQNKKDIYEAKKNNLPNHLLDRLILDEKRILSL